MGTISWSKPYRSLYALLSDSPLGEIEFGEEGERSPVRDVQLEEPGCSR
jgi:hypothetical protein